LGAAPFGLLGMIVLVAAIESALAIHWLEFSDPVSLSWRYSAQAAQNRVLGRDVIVLGDSLAKHGLVPAVLERASGLRSVNLAAARCPTLMTYFLFRRALDAGALPPAIVINSKPAVLMGGVDYNARYWRETASLRETMELFEITHRTDVVVSTLLGRLLPSLRSRLEIRSSLLAALEGRRDPLHDINRVLWRNWTVNDGANVATLNPGYDGELSADVLDRLHPRAHHVDRSNIAGIERLLALADRRRIRVFWLLPPIAPALQALRDTSGAEARFEGLVRRYQERYAGTVTVLDARHGFAGPRMYVDATHLSGRGAIALSRAVGRELEAELFSANLRSAGPWIALSVRADADLGAPELALEDIDRSKRVLHLEGGDNGRAVRR
jgi:hypothetical protein